MMTPHQLEAATAIGWPAATEVGIAGWRVFAGLGPVGRVNSCWPLVFNGNDVDLAIDQVEHFYRAKGLLPQFKIIVEGHKPEGLRAKLIQRGYHVRSHTAVMTRDTHLGEPEHDVAILPNVTQRFLDVVTQTSPTVLDGQERSDILARLPTPSAFGTITVDGDVAAIGLAILTGDSAGIAAMRTKPEYRGRGYARAILRAVSARAFGTGAKTLWLQVETDNDPALRLYRSEGFGVAYHYETMRLSSD